MKKQQSPSFRSPKVVPLSHGVTAIVDSIENVESLTCGFWVSTGARHDPQARAGLAHFFEHMLFKGTESRSAYRLAVAIEACGGYINACTSREQTAFYVRMPSAHLDTGLSILIDMISNASFHEKEIALERDVVLQEIAQSYDSPDDHIFDIFQEQVFPNDRLGRPILGYRESVLQASRTDLQAHRARHYTGGKMVVSLSGRGDFDSALHRLERDLSTLPQAAQDSADESAQDKGADFHTSQAGQERAIEQCHTIIGFPAFGRHHESYYTAQVLCALLGHGMASPLFQEIREKRGLAYTIFSFYQGWQDTGLLAFYAASDRNRLEELLRAVHDCLSAHLEDLAEEDIARAKAQMISSLVMRLESPPQRAAFWASQFLYHAKIPEPRKIIGKIEAIDKANLCALAHSIFNSDKSALSVLGPVSSHHLSKMGLFGTAA